MTIESLFKPDYVVNFRPIDNTSAAGGWIDIAQIRMMNFHVVLKNAAPTGNTLYVVGTNHRPPLSGDYYKDNFLDEDFVTLTEKPITTANDNFCFEIVTAFQFVNAIFKSGVNPSNFSISIHLSGK